MNKRLDKFRGSGIPAATDAGGYDQLLGNITGLLEAARRASARVVNALMTATYWEVGRSIVEYEQGGKERAEYGEMVLQRLAVDLTKRFGRGFGVDNLQRMRVFYLDYPPNRIYATVSRKWGMSEKSATASRKLFPPKSQALSDKFQIFQTPPEKIDASCLSALAQAFPLSWSHYVRLLSVASPEARAFYETEALRGGWSVRQLDRQISTQFYERTALSRNKAAMLEKGGKPLPADAVLPEQEIKDPFILEFLGLKDEYSETDLEDALVQHLERFLLELGGDFAFIGRQKRLRIGNEWYRVDLLFFHRKLRCLVVIDLKVGRFTHADAGQMHLYLNYAREHWARSGENPPVGLILCAEKDSAVAKYALAGLLGKVLTAEYKLALPDEKTLAAEIEQTRKILEARKR